ncbi:MAG: helix-turn-helix transcriptional regulator [Candidatus Dormibacteraceae bacterium]
MDPAPVDDIVRELGIGRTTLYRLIKKYKLPLYKREGDRRSYVDRERIRSIMELRPKDGAGQE